MGARIEGDQVVVEIKRAEPVIGDRVLMAVGRIPFTDRLGLESVRIEQDERGRILVDDHFETSAKGIFAIGDVIRGPMLAHKAQEEGNAVVEWIVTGHGHVDYNCIPAIVYTSPEIATVGKSEDELRQSGVPHGRGLFPFKENGRALLLGNDDGFVKVLTDAATDRILGVHIIGPHAGEMIAEAAAAMAYGATAEDLSRTCHAHPTLSEALRDAARAVGDRSANG
jgi:dihydrolipoamide dehydrogenase